MTEPLAALTRAAGLLADTGTSATLGPPTSGHWCNCCETRSVIAADLLRIDMGGVTKIATFFTCTNCEPC